jgi:hypothetical protein
MPEVNGDVDGDAQIDHHDREDEKVHRRVEARVILIALWGSHR